MGAIPLRGRLRVFAVSLTPPKRGHEPYLKNPQALLRVDLKAFGAVARGARGNKAKKNAGWWLVG